MQTKFVKQITQALSLYQYNDIPILKLQHPLGEAEISLQGAQLLRWRPKSAQQDILWLSEIDPFVAGKAIRGGIPICYPWFGPIKEPMHGYARIRLWQLSDYQIDEQKVRLDFSLFSSDNLIEAKLTIIFTEQCELCLTHYGNEPAQAALHTYFNIGDIVPVQIEGLPTQCFNKLTEQQEKVPSPRTISENVDCIYQIQPPVTQKIVDPTFNRTIQIEQLEASNTVLWNPWHKPTSNMSENGYQTMVCVESAKLDQTMQQGDTIIVKISLN
ncbi:MAG: D-hexose-6-phosphate mutarotase [[Pasteurella] aerogenes]|nr:D-hexose-6-phosphate mutarotase [[Pasteurella] aerogenes]